MIQRDSILNVRYMKGFELSHTNETITIGEGVYDSHPLPEVQFDLIYDTEMPILHDLYIVEVDGEYDYRLAATYMDGRTWAFYEEDGILIHRLMSITTQPDGSYSGDFVFIEKQEVVKEGYNEDFTPPNQEGTGDN